MQALPGLLDAQDPDHHGVRDALFDLWAEEQRARNDEPLREPKCPQCPDGDATIWN